MDAPSATVRFAVVVQRCGQPEPLTFWGDPDKDPDLQRALKENRVATDQAGCGREHRTQDAS
jgi:hypothetical protein